MRGGCLDWSRSRQISYDTIPLALAGNVWAASAGAFEGGKRQQKVCRNLPLFAIGSCRL